jgi:hypothetical protein
MIGNIEFDSFYKNCNKIKVLACYKQINSWFFVKIIAKC